MDSTETFWEIDGVSLQTMAFNIATLGGDRMAPPPVRGDDLVVPYRPGALWVPKVVDKRVVTLGFWVIGADEDGFISDTEDGRRVFDRNWRKLRNLLWRPRTQFTLTKRFWVPTDDLIAGGVDTSGMPHNGSWSLLTASATASYVSGLVPTMSGPTRAVFTVDLMLNDPYFYSAPITVPFSTSTAGGDPGPTKTISVLGDDRTTAITFDFEGPLTSPQFTLTGYPNDPWFRYGTVIADGDQANVRVKAFSSTQTTSLATYTSSGYAQHYGDRFWFYLDPGPSPVALTVQEGTGTAVLTYSPAWM